jgi:hypothetical protein
MDATASQTRLRGCGEVPINEWECFAWIGTNALCTTESWDDA